MKNAPKLINKFMGDMPPGCPLFKFCPHASETGTRHTDKAVEKREGGEDAEACKHRRPQTTTQRHAQTCLTLRAHGIIAYAHMPNTADLRVITGALCC